MRPGSFWIISLFMAFQFCAGFAQATTTGRFVGPQMLLGLVSHGYDGSVDSSPQRLYELMDRPIQESMMGKGKSLATEKKILNFVCSDRGQGNFSCAINIHKSPFSQVSAQKATFEARGEDARHLFSQFHSQNGRISFRDESNLFMIEATPESFLMVYSAGGI